MIKKLTTLSFALAVSAACMALPAKRGQYKMLTLNDGTTVQAQLMGDEHRNWYHADNGNMYVLDRETKSYCQVQSENIPYQFETPQIVDKGIRKAAGKKPSEPVVGERKGIIVLVQFSDVKFQDNHDKAFYEKVVNSRNFSSDDGYVGSVRDYYYDQSDGKLDYTFDIIGPVTLPNTQKYYGEHVGNTNDVNLTDFVKHTTDLIKNQVNFADYDNDNDGEVDNIFFIYAGKQEADGGGTDCLWPHMYYYPYLGLSYKQNGVNLNVYACAGELQHSYANPDAVIPAGIGAICHEFSHCLGLPDLYDTANGATYGADDWSIMDSGCYLGSAFRPCGYSAYERWWLGWRDLIELSDKDVTVTDATPLTSGGQGYQMFNDNNTRESYIAEPRKKEGWDTNLPNSGLLMWHIDYLQSAWTSNVVNNTASHQRCFVVCADNSTANTNTAYDVFPYNTLDMFTDETTPAATLFNANSDGSKLLHKSIYDIKKNADGIVSFKYMPGVFKWTNTDKPEGAIFYEGFKRCNGVGGNDGNFKTGFSGSFLADNDGWTYNSSYAGLECARFGTATKDGWATTPSFSIDGTVVLTFKAAPYNLDPEQVELSIASGDATLDTAVFPLASKKWTDCKTTITGNGDIKIKFQGYSRMLLDEVLVMPEGASGIEAVNMTTVAKNSSFFNILGQRVNDSIKGITIRNGKKYFVK